MRYVCLWSPHWSAGEAQLAEVASLLLAEVPRVAVEERGVIWADVRGLPAARVAERMLARLGRAAGEGTRSEGSPASAAEEGEGRSLASPTTTARAGVADLPVAAELAARSATQPVTVVSPGEARAFLAPLPLTLLGPDPRLLALLDGVGLTCCGELASLPREAVEVRLGPEGVHLWRLARGDDSRSLFRPVAPERPHASIEFVDYEVTDAARLVFTANALLGTVCDTLRTRAERSRVMTLSLTLGSGSVLRRQLRCSRPTALRGPWLDRVRDLLERLSLPDTVTGVMLESSGEEPSTATQGDLFDRGFATAGAVEEAVARLADTLGVAVVMPERSEHPLAEERTRWVVREGVVVTEDPPTKGARGQPAATPAYAIDGFPVAPRVEEANPVSASLALQLLANPRPVRVKSEPRRDHLLPLAYQEGRRWVQIVEAAGPDRVSGGHDGEGFAREYFRCATAEGGFVWLYRDGVGEGWFMHGWWD